MPGILDDRVGDFITALAHQEHDHPVLGDMERRAAEHGFPIVGHAVGRLLELQARMVGARRVFELGSGYGYSAYWFARAVGAGGEVHCTDGDPANAALAEDHLRRAELWDRVTFHTGDALTRFAEVGGEFDVVYNDIDKDGYPDAWRAAAERVRVGGLYLCDNVLWGGRVTTGEDRDGMEGWTAAIQEHDRLVAQDHRYVSTIVPIRDGVLVALRVE
jgi:caffeoyl-CoA O-methyltransferase